MRITSRVKWPTVLMFFWFVYHSVAEGLPEGIVKMECVYDRAQHDADGDSLKSVCTWSLCSARVNQNTI